jgi:hypothetical protein
MKIDLFVRAVREPKKTKKSKKKVQQRYISRICGGGTPKDGELKLGTFVEFMDVINHTNFYLFHVMNSFRASSGGVKNEDLPLKGVYGSYNIALRFRAGMITRYIVEIMIICWPCFPISGHSIIMFTLGVGGGSVRCQCVTGGREGLI